MPRLYQIIFNFKNFLLYRKSFKKVWKDVMKVARSMKWISDEELHALYKIKINKDKKMAVNYIVSRECMKWSEQCNDAFLNAYSEYEMDDEMSLDERDAAEKEPTIWDAMDDKYKTEIGEIKSLLGK